MIKKIFLAGATGVIGRSLIPILRSAGHKVTGMTRSAGGEEKLRAEGVEAAVEDVFDRDALERAVAKAGPDVIIDELTDLGGVDAQSAELGIERNARLRREGTANLAAAARSAGAGRMIAQSIAWAYAPKDPPYRESDPLDLGAKGTRAISISGGILPLENEVLDQSDFTGIVLR